MPPRFDTLSEAARWYDAWLGEAALPLWAGAGVDPAGGLFQETLSVEGRPVEAPRRARAQARQVFVFASAATAGYGERWLPVAREGWARFVTVYRRPDGLFINRASGDGAPLDAGADIYEQAFVLLAMAALQAADPAAGDLAGEAERVLTALEARRNPAGGFREAGSHPFQANCHMHLFESALAWEAAGGPRWAALSGAGGLVEPGHQFEWAWLLERWGRSRGDAAARTAAVRLFQNGLRGVDPIREVAVNALWDDFSSRDGAARLWPQTEHLKAALVLGDEAQGVRAARGLAHYLDVPARGAWRDKLQADGSFVEEPAPATSFYHLMVAILELRSHLGTAA